MSLPSDLGEILELLRQFYVKHGIKSVSFHTVMEESGEVVSSNFGIEHETGAVWELRQPRIIGEIPSALKSLIVTSIRGHEASKKAHVESIAVNEASIKEADDKAAQMRELIPSALIELARCADEENDPKMGKKARVVNSRRGFDGRIYREDDYGNPIDPYGNPDFGGHYGNGSYGRDHQ